MESRDMKVEVHKERYVEDVEKGSTNLGHKVLQVLVITFENEFGERVLDRA